MKDDNRLVRFAQYAKEGSLSPGYGDSYLFFAGRDDIHGIMRDLLRAERLALKMNMFGYDDEELNNLIMAMFKDPDIHVQVSLDRSQASGVHEKKIIAADEATDPADFNNSFVILESGTHQISHTKGGVLVGQGLYFEGSTNWSSSGEGEGINLSGAAPKGFKSQNNTLLVSANPVNLRRFSVQLDAEHQIGLQQQLRKGVKSA